MTLRKLFHSGSAAAIKATVSVGVIVSAVLLGCSTQPESGPDTSGTSATGGVYRNLDPSVSYIGIEACAECHPLQATTYVESQMGRSFKPATRALSAADWDNAHPVYDPFVDFYYFPFADGDSLYLMEYRLADGDTVHTRIEKIDYIVGSGQHTNSHMMEINGYIYQMPITWYAQEKVWDIPPGFDEGSNWRFDREINVECMTCHNAMPDYIEGSSNRFGPLPHGINCERCHGPGELHAAEIRAGKIVDISQKIDWTIVHPGKLPLDLQFDVCQRCHLQGVAVPREGLTFTDFRPGMRLGDVIDVYFPRYTDSLSHFIMASHPDRLRMAKCRIPSKTAAGRMDPLPCIACHNPHVPVKSIGSTAYNQVCIDCHGGIPEDSTQTAESEDSTQTAESEDSTQTAESVAPECTEEFAVRAAQDEDCSFCHMPLVKSIDIPHVRITDHNIRILDRETGQGPSTNGSQGTPGSNEEQKRFVRLASLTSAQPSHKMIGEGYLAYYEQFNRVKQFLDSASVNLDRARRVQSDREMARTLVRLWFLQEDYEAIAEFADRVNLSGSDYPWTFYRIGEAYSNLGRHKDARLYYQRAVDRGPDHLWFRTKLASAYVALEDPIRALEILDAVLRDNPKFQHAYNNRGFAHLLAGNSAQAESDFRMTLALDPDARLALANLASLYFNSGEPAKAKPLIDQLVRIEPDNPQYTAFQQAVREAL